jgi:hypothetical protein
MKVIATLIIGDKESSFEAEIFKGETLTVYDDSRETACQIQIIKDTPIRWRLIFAISEFLNKFSKKHRNRMVTAQQIINKHPININ